MMLSLLFAMIASLFSSSFLGFIAGFFRNSLSTSTDSTIYVVRWGGGVQASQLTKPTQESKKERKQRNKGEKLDQRKT